MERMPFSKYVAKKRALQGKSQKQLAEALSYTPQAISRFESLNSAFPIELLDPLCKFLECSIDDLLERNLESSAYRKVTIDWDSLPKNLAEARKSSSLSKEAFAEALGISSRVIRNYESGSTAPSFQLLESWADLSKKQAADFLKKPVVVPQKPPHAPLPFYKRRPILIPLIAVVTIAVPAASIAIPFAVKETKRNGSHSEASSLNEESSPIEESSVPSSFEVPSSSESESFSSPDEGSSSVSSTESQESSSSSESLPPASYNIEPVLSEDGKTLTYGYYPQTHVNDEPLIASLNEIAEPEANGWYLFDGQYYAKSQKELGYSGDSFDDGTAIETNGVYWFQCKPIEWKVLSIIDGKALVVSKFLLDAHRYNEEYPFKKDDHYANNYKESEIRQWLNSDFLSTAFCLGDSALELTTVDNSAATTDDAGNIYASDSTEDKVFLLSYKDYFQTPAYGFTDDESRVAETTDYARAKGAFPATIEQGLRYSPYWTRSPYSYYSYTASFVHQFGYVGTIGVSSGDYCVRPAITVRI